MNLADLGITGVTGITVLCYLCALAVKSSPISCKWIPLLCGTLGLILGIVGLYTMPSFPASDPISAAAVGAVSGFAATGVHQACRQLKKTPAA